MLPVNRATFGEENPMRRKFTAFGGGAALVLAAITIPATTAAAVNYNIYVDIPDNWTQAESTLSWSIEDTAEPICNDATIAIDGGSQPDAIITVNDDGTGGEIDLAAAAGSNLFIFDFAVICGNDEYFGHLEFHSVQINKNVASGVAPSGTFEVELSVTNFDDTDFSDTILFDADGGSATYYGFNIGEWSVEETDDNGAYRVETDAPLMIDESGAYELGITNYFPVYVRADIIPPSDRITTETNWGWESDPHYPAVCEDGEVSTWYANPMTTGGSLLDSPFEITVGDDGYRGTIDIGNADESGFYNTYVICEDDGQIFAYTLDTAVDVFTLTKEVEGDAPTGAAFSIEVTASNTPTDGGEITPGPDTHTLTVSFGADGGMTKLYHPEGGAFWSVEETETGGADTVDIVEQNYLDNDVSPFATVTNIFETDEPVDEPGDEPEEPGDTPADDRNGDSADEAAATPVKAVPKYAG